MHTLIKKKKKTHTKCIKTQKNNRIATGVRLPLPKVFMRNQLQSPIAFGRRRTSRSHFRSADETAASDPRCGLIKNAWTTARGGGAPRVARKAPRKSIARVSRNKKKITRTKMCSYLPAHRKIREMRFCSVRDTHPVYWCPVPSRAYCWCVEIVSCFPVSFLFVRG